MWPLCMYVAFTLSPYLTMDTLVDPRLRPLWEVSLWTQRCKCSLHMVKSFGHKLSSGIVVLYGKCISSFLSSFNPVFFLDYTHLYFHHRNSSLSTTSPASGSLCLLNNNKHWHRDEVLSHCAFDLDYLDSDVDCMYVCVYLLVICFFAFLRIVYWDSLPVLLLLSL